MYGLLLMINERVNDLNLISAINAGLTSNE